MKADKDILQLKYSSVIKVIANKLQITLREAMTIFYNSSIYDEMREGISDMHCRSDIYLADDIILENNKLT